MKIAKSTYFLSGVVLVVMTLSVTVFRSEKGQSPTKQQVRINNARRYEDRKDRYPVAEYDEAEPSDPLKRAKLKRQKKRYDKDAPFTNPGPVDEELAFRPEAQFDFPALPVAKSDVIVIGQVLEAKAHRSDNKMNVFSNFEIRVAEVLKGTNLASGSVITIERVGGFVLYPNGRKVLFRQSGNGMPAVNTRYAFFLRTDEEDYSILTAYELGPEGVVPLDNSPQFQALQGMDETSFLKTLRDSLSQVPQ